MNSLRRASGRYRDIMLELSRSIIDEREHERWLKEVQKDLQKSLERSGFGVEWVEVQSDVPYGIGYENHLMIDIAFDHTLSTTEYEITREFFEERWGLPHEHTWSTIFQNKSQMHWNIPL
jgi:hypothetical protein